MTALSDKVTLTDEEILLLGDAASLITRGNEEKSNPSKLRLILVELQALRFQIGRVLGNYRAETRSEMSSNYWNNKSLYKMSPNAAYKEAELNEKVVALKNNRDFMELTYDTIADFVSTNQSSLKVATEEAKNTL